MNLKFELYGWEGKHPLKVMEGLGITYQHATPQSMTDQWWFWNCENVPNPLPPMLSVLDLDPQKCIGYGLSKEDADNIESYTTKP